MLEKWRRRARALKQTTHVLFLAARHPRTPWYAKLLAAVVVGYALSPIDLVPDPIPILGQLDDAVLLPLGIWLTMKLIPETVWTECEARARESPAEPRPASVRAAVMVVVLWLLAAYLAVRAAWPLARTWSGL